jgi:hypothetical protein
MCKDGFLKEKRMSKMNTEDKVWMSAYVMIVLVILTTFIAWGTHIVVCLQDERWGFLIAGAIAVPVAVVHGVGIWFGWWN